MRYDSIVIGGGMVGMQAGISLGAYGLQVAVVDKQQATKTLNKTFDRRTSALSFSSSNVMKKSGIWKNLSPHLCPMRKVLIEDRDMVTTHVTMDYDASLTPDRPLGYIVENRVVRKAQHQHTRKQKNITQYLDCTVKDIRYRGDLVEVYLSDGRVLQTRLVVGADGKESFVAKSVGIGNFSYSYRQMAIICTVACERPHADIAVELFLPNGPFAMLPMNNNRMSIVWTEKVEVARKILAMSKKCFLSQLKKRFGRWLGAITLVDDTYSGYPLILQHAKTYVAPRTVLVGDAAHSTHPVAGQGFNMGVRDVAALTECVVVANRMGKDIGAQSVLKEYEQYRYVDNASLLAACHGIVLLFSNNNFHLRMLRGLGLSLVNKSALAKKFFLSHSTGTNGRHIPKLLRGQDL